ncbi:unnamed protein product [Angiostrongylus costaricensis]|uniref:Col_cuticle_N domain-containing protein n=1 Tax=Angiostrongylus costaricensis TaxID=334426 RepID=A0A0R3PPD0_ANGCS|nr:unnamed protein product [Angiostrongylus costaricensis]
MTSIYAIYETSTLSVVIARDLRLSEALTNLRRYRVINVVFVVVVVVVVVVIVLVRVLSQGRTQLAYCRR